FSRKISIWEVLSVIPRSNHFLVKIERLFCLASLVAVIDFGMLAVGDPACDLAIAWTLFEGESREVFRSLLALDEEIWARGRAWTLWKALIIAAGVTDSNTVESTQSWQIIDEVLSDHRQSVKK
ncbi:hypothetical protein SCG7086_CM_00010, partial [Chlamydiales bacterium SCGC AG-110-P3]